LVVDIFGGSGTTAAVAQKMRRRWLIAERNIKTVLDFLLPRLQHVINGTDPGGFTESCAWLGGGSFEAICIPPRFGKQPSSNEFGAIKQSLAKAAILKKQLRKAS
jgi:adenine-specific DNA-methyltransferase